MKNIFSYENVKISVDDLLIRGDSCGLDGIYVSRFEEYWRMNQTSILEKVWEGKYFPGSVQEIGILQRNGKRRTISKYNCTDRVLQHVIKRYLEPGLDKKFSPNSFAYRPDKGTQDAALQAATFIQSGKKWVAELDIENFFDNINLERLSAMLRKEGVGGALDVLIHKYLYIEVQDDFGRKRKTCGIIQGSPMSPLFSNLYLNEADHVLGMKYSYCRFADNINIYCEDKEETEQARKEVELYLREKLGLRLNRSKSGVYPALNRKYLGYEFYRSEKSDDILIRRAQRESRSSYNRWHRSAIERVDRNYHIISDGILTRKDYTVLFENKEQKMYLPVETCGMLNVYSNVFFSSAFFEFAAQKN